jgi:Amt family ammonium transporter
LGTAAYTAVVTIGVVHVTRLATGGLRVDHDDEIKGLDSAIHGERAFEIEF